MKSETEKPVFRILIQIVDITKITTMNLYGKLILPLQILTESIYLKYIIAVNIKVKNITVHKTMVLINKILVIHRSEALYSLPFKMSNKKRDEKEDMVTSRCVSRETNSVESNVSNLTDIILMITIYLRWNFVFLSL